MPLNKLKETERMFVHTVAFQHGIVPMEDPAMDVNRALKELPPDEARAMKRKFRKMWRKTMRAELARRQRVQATYNAKVTLHKTNPTEEEIKAEMAKLPPQTKPTRDEKNRRKREVFNKMWKDQVEPMVKKFKTIERT